MKAKGDCGAVGGVEEGNPAAAGVTPEAVRVHHNTHHGHKPFWEEWNSGLCPQEEKLPEAMLCPVSLQGRGGKYTYQRPHLVLLSVFPERPVYGEK